MPTSVTCKTFHSLALAHLAPFYHGKVFAKRGGDNSLDYLQQLKRVDAYAYEGFIFVPSDHGDVEPDDGLRRRKQYVMKDGRVGYNFRVRAKDVLNITKDAVGFFYRSVAPEPTIEHAKAAISAKLSEAVLDTQDGQVLAKAVLAGATKIWQDAISTENSWLVDNPHDFYLKLWQLKDPQINFDVILFDESQDADGLMLDILSKQKAQIIYVGDPHQQIYAWRGAQNAIENIKAPSKYLTTSFRFGENIASTASDVLGFLGESKRIKGFQSCDKIDVFDVVHSRIDLACLTKDIQPNAILTRTNSGALGAALTLMRTELQFTLEMDIKSVENRIKQLVTLINQGYETKEREIAISSWLDQLKDAKDNHDPSLGVILPPDLPVASKAAVQDGAFESRNIHDLADLIIYEFENPSCVEITRYFKWIREHTADYLLKMLSGAKEDKGIVVGTGHKAKGMEWDCVYLHEDIAEHLAYIYDDKPFALKELKEDFRLFYVLLTRAKKHLVLHTKVAGLLDLIQDVGEYSNIREYNKKPEVQALIKKMKERRGG